MLDTPDKPASSLANSLRSGLFLLGVLFDLACLKRILKIQVVADTVLDGCPVCHKARNPFLVTTGWWIALSDVLDEKQALRLC